jgi:hypothetical protein
MSLLDEQASRLGFWVVLLGALFAWAPAAFPGYWQAVEGFVPVFNVLESSPLAQVAVTPDLWRGTGRAAYLPAQSLVRLGLTPTGAVQAVFALSFLLGGLGIYTWLRPRLGDRAAGLAGLVYVWLPPFLATVYVRGSLSDALVLGLLPLALAGTASYADSRTPIAAAVMVICLLWVWQVQAGLALLATLLLLLYAGWVERSRLALLIVTVTGIAGLASLIPLWDVRGSPPVVFADHFLDASQLLIGGSVSGQASEPFQLGFAALFFSLCALWLWRRGLGRLATGWRTGMQGRLLAFCFGGALILFALSLSWAAPLWHWSGAERLLTYPWQLVLLASPLLAMTAGSLSALNDDLARAPLWTALAALALLGSYGHLTADFTQVTPPATPVAVIGANQELVLLDAELTERPITGTVTLDVTWQVLRPLDFDYQVFFQAVQPTAAGGETVITQLDVQPLQGERAATTWQPGEILTEQYQLAVDRAALEADEPLRYLFGYYDWRDGARLPVDGGRDDKLILYGE